MTRKIEPDPEIDALVQKLNRSAHEAPAAQPAYAEDPGSAGPRFEVQWVLPRCTDEGENRLGTLLAAACSRHASDLLLVAGSPPAVRVHGGLTPIEETPLTAGTVGMLAGALVPAARRPMVENRGSVDFAISRPEAGRLRCNVHRERGRWSAAIRFLPPTVADLEALHLPPALATFAEMEHGLILATGPTGTGKSTTLAALVKRILSHRRVHLVTIEDPVEYEHPHGQSVVEHVEIGRDATSFAGALRAALRQDPDVILIGEMRDPESISIAITAAETGHLVLSTLHTGDAPQTVHRILDSYPPNQMDAVRAQLSISIAGILSQQLLPRIDGAGRVPAVEILVGTPAVRNLIRQGKIAQLRSQFTLERQSGMLSLDESLAGLVRAELVDATEARARARIPEEFDQLVRRGTRRGETTLRGKVLD